MNWKRTGFTPVLFAALSAAAGAQGDGIRSVAGKDLEVLADGSRGRVVEYRGADGTYIPAYLRTPKGSGPFPVVVMLHGGAAHPGVTHLLGRTSKPPAADFVAAGWALLSIDYHPAANNSSSDRPDAMAAIQAVRRLPSIDAKRVALFGGSHGGNVISRIISKVDVRCAVMCAPALLDLYEISKVVDQGVEVAGILKKILAGAPQKYGAPLAQVVKDPARYGYESALLEAPQARCPVLIVNGRNDTSAPIRVTETYVKALRAADKQVETYFPEDGRHGFYFGFMDNRNSGKPPEVTPETREAARRAVDFIRRYFAQ